MDVVLFFIIDTSSSMAEGEKIIIVNTTIEAIIPAIRELADENPRVRIKIAALEFSSGVRWVTADGPVEIERFQWKASLRNAYSIVLLNACRHITSR